MICHDKEWQHRYENDDKYPGKPIRDELRQVLEHGVFRYNSHHFYPGKLRFSAEIIHPCIQNEQLLRVFGKVIPQHPHPGGL